MKTTILGENMLEQLVEEAVWRERDRCVKLVQHYLVYNCQRAVSYHEIQDCLKMMREEEP